MRIVSENLSVCIIGMAIGKIDSTSPQNKFRATRRAVNEVVRIEG